MELVCGICMPSHTTLYTAALHTVVVFFSSVPKPVSLVYAKQLPFTLTKKCLLNLICSLFFIPVKKKKNKPQCSLSVVGAKERTD